MFPIISILNIENLNTFIHDKDFSDFFFSLNKIDLFYNNINNRKIKDLIINNIEKYFKINNNNIDYNNNNNNNNNNDNNNDNNNIDYNNNNNNNINNNNNDYDLNIFLEGLKIIWSERIMEIILKIIDIGEQFM
jgi:hypothetical protein